MATPTNVILTKLTATEFVSFAIASIFLPVLGDLPQTLHCVFLFLKKIKNNQISNQVPNKKIVRIA